jgi:hypothetical protein
MRSQAWGSPNGPPPGEQGPGVVLPCRDDRYISSCVWLRICGKIAAFCRDLAPQEVDLLDRPEGQMKFETRHSPHFSQLRKLMIKGLVSQ